MIRAACSAVSPSARHVARPAKRLEMGARTIEDPRRAEAGVGDRHPPGLSRRVARQQPGEPRRPAPRAQFPETEADVWRSSGGVARSGGSAIAVAFQVDPRARRICTGSSGRASLVGELQGRGAIAETAYWPACRRRRRRALGIGGLDRQEEDVVDRHRPAGPEGVERAGDIPRPGQRENSVISGTWSEGRSQWRQVSNTLWAGASGATSALAHIWSSRRPRSFTVQSGER